MNDFDEENPFNMEPMDHPEIDPETEVYAYFFKSRDEDGETQPGLVNISKEYETPINKSLYEDDLISFLSQTDESFLGYDGIVYEVYEGVEQSFAYAFEVTGDDWEMAKGNIQKAMDAVDKASLDWIVKFDENNKLILDETGREIPNEERKKELRKGSKKCFQEVLSAIDEYLNEKNQEQERDDV